MAEAAAIGVRPSEFWGMTPRELRASFAGHRKRTRRDAQLAMFNAWHAGAFARYNPKKRLPPLQQLIEKLGERRDMSDTQLRSALMGWHSAAGGDVRVVPKGTVTGSRPWPQLSAPSGQT